MRSTLHDPILTAEHRLWRAVLEQAYVDAETGPDALGTRTDGDCDGSQECLRARCYLRGDSKPARQVVGLLRSLTAARTPNTRHDLRGSPVSVSNFG